jgi:hypothetical protein
VLYFVLPPLLGGMFLFSERLVADQPDYVLLLAWNFADEILAQQAEYLKRGGRFILPVVEVRILP